MKVGVVIDSWKLPIFKLHLDEAGYAYTEHPGLTADTRLLQVTCEWSHKLQPIVRAANDECRAVSAAAAQEPG